jgi:hypothetical protein
MTYDELFEYWMPVANKFFPKGAEISGLDGLHGHIPYQAVDRLLGIDEYTYGYYHASQRTKPSTPISQELKQLLVALAGPHGDTILKIYRIQKGLDE